MIRHQSAMIVSIYFEIGASFLSWKSKIKSVVQVAYWQFTSMWRPILFTEKKVLKTQRICKMKSKDDNIDKKNCDKNRYGTKRLLAEFPNKTFATHNTVKRLQRKIDDTVAVEIRPWTPATPILGVFCQSWDGTCQDLSIHQIWSF